MKRTLTEQYGLIKKGKGHKDVFLKEAKKLYPNFIRPGAAFNEASTILKQKNIINENFVGMEPINNPFETKKKEGYETAFENFLKEAKSLEDIVKDITLPKSEMIKTLKPFPQELAKFEIGLEKKVMEKAKEEGLNPTEDEVEEEVGKQAGLILFGSSPRKKRKKFLGIFEAKAEEKKVSKEVEEDQSKAYDNRDEKNPNNMIFGQIQMGYYCELKNPKNANKTDTELLDIVHKNLTKDPIYYTKNGQFGEEGIGYTDDNVSLGIPKEAKGPHKSSGYGTLRESKSLKEHSVSMAGGIVTGGGFVNMNYMDYFGLNEAEGDPDDAAKVADETERARDAAKEISDMELFQEDDLNSNPELIDLDTGPDEDMDALATAAEDAYDSGMEIEEIIEFIKQHLGLKFGDY